MITVVAWNTADSHVHPVGPTATGAASLTTVIREARARFDCAEIVPWEMRGATPAQVAARFVGEALDPSETMPEIEEDDDE